jgi:hypothetical protein
MLEARVFLPHILLLLIIIDSVSLISSDYLGEDVKEFDDLERELAQHLNQCEESLDGSGSIKKKLLIVVK